MALPFRAGDEALFLTGDQGWRHGLGPGFKGKKFLGRGSFGVAGLWTYNQPLGHALRPSITSVVVKMSQIELGGTDRDGLNEGAIGLILSKFQSPHLVRQFGGNRLGDRFYEMEDVVRIFLEYCPGGDLQQLMPDERNSEGTRLAEVDLWAIFHCLAKGTYALERRTERPGVAATVGQDMELLHHDLKLDNVFLGNRDAIEHPRIPIAKIGDFGESEFVDFFSLQTDAYGGAYDGKGAETFMPPEATINAPDRTWLKAGVPLIEPRKGTCSNIWQVGAILNTLIRLTLLDFNPQTLTPSIHPKTSNLKASSSSRAVLLSSELNHSQGLEDPQIKALYSTELLILVQECMFRTPRARPKAHELTERTSLGLQTAKNAPGMMSPRKRPRVPPQFGDMPVLPTGDNPPEPPHKWDVNYVRAADGNYVQSSPAPQRNRFGTRLQAVVSAGVSMFKRKMLDFGDSVLSEKMFDAASALSGGTLVDDYIVVPDQDNERWKGSVNTVDQVNEVTSFGRFFRVS